MSTNRSKDRPSLCSFMFVDGRHCRTLDCGGLAAAFEAKPPTIHACKEAHRNNSLCSLCSAFCALCGKSFSSLTGPHWPGQVKPKTASTLAYLGQTLVQILPLAQHEYINAYDTDTWCATIRESHEQSANHSSPDPQSPAPEPEPDPEPEPAPAPARTTPSDESPTSE